MIIVNSRAGQRGNRLVTIANAMAAAIERGEDLRLTAFGEFAADYACRVTWNGKVRIGDSAAFELVRKMIAAAKRLGWRRLLRGRVVSDWDFRARELVEKHADAIRAFFAPSRPRARLDRASDEIVVGVHKRRGDYREFLGGRYYYDDAVYDRNARALAEHFARQGKRTRFFVFPLGDAAADLETMAECDCLLGPPSSFSAWAGFMGRVPLAVIWNRDYTVGEKDVVYRGLYV